MFRILGFLFVSNLLVLGHAVAQGGEQSSGTSELDLVSRECEIEAIDAPKK